MREVVKVISAATDCDGAVDKAIYCHRNELIPTVANAPWGSLLPRARPRHFCPSSGTKGTRRMDAKRRRREDGMANCKDVARSNSVQIDATKSSHGEKDICVAPPGPTGHYRDSQHFPAMQM